MDSNVINLERLASIFISIHSLLIGSGPLNLVRLDAGDSVLAFPFVFMQAKAFGFGFHDSRENTHLQHNLAWIEIRFGTYWAVIIQI